MVEWSNTLVLGTNLFGGLGSNPSRVILDDHMPVWGAGADCGLSPSVIALISFSSLDLFRVLPSDFSSMSPRIASSDPSLDGSGLRGTLSCMHHVPSTRVEAYHASLDGNCF